MTDRKQNKYPSVVHGLKSSGNANIHIFNPVLQQNKRNVYFVTYGDNEISLKGTKFIKFQLKKNMTSKLKIIFG